MDIFVTSYLHDLVDRPVIFTLVVNVGILLSDMIVCTHGMTSYLSIYLSEWYFTRFGEKSNLLWIITTHNRISKHEFSLQRPVLLQKRHLSPKDARPAACPDQDNWIQYISQLILETDSTLLTGFACLLYMCVTAKVYPYKIGCIVYDNVIVVS